MKKKSTSQSAFFNPRFLIGAFVALAGISLALFATANPVRPTAAQAQQKYKVTTQSSIDPLVPAGFDCSKIHRLGIDRQENLRAGAVMIFCGLSEGGKSFHGRAFSKLVQRLTAPVAFGSTDVDLITGTESFPNVTQSETFTTANPDDPTQVVVAYNDSRGRNFTPINISGASVSTDGGTTFTRLTKANGQSPFDNTFGDPVVLYHKPSGTWVTVWLDGACGGQGLGGYKSITPDDPNSWTHFCAFNEGSADRESGWADNNPSSPFFGRLYVSWNDFNQPNANIFVVSSTDAGATWSSAHMVSTQATFIRDVQITGDLAGSGTIYVAGMDEGGVAVVLARPRRPVVLPAGVQGGTIESVDGGFVLGVECQVDGRPHVAGRDPEVVASALDETEGVLVLLVHLVAQGREHALVELAARHRVPAAEADVLDHGEPDYLRSRA